MLDLGTSADIATRNIYSPGYIQHLGLHLDKLFNTRISELG